MCEVKVIYLQYFTLPCIQILFVEEEKCNIVKAHILNRVGFQSIKGSKYKMLLRIIPTGLEM